MVADLSALKGRRHATHDSPQNVYIGLGEGLKLLASIQEDHTLRRHLESATSKIKWWEAVVARGWEWVGLGNI